jgi:type IV pilus assembly protein PilC
MQFEYLIIDRKQKRSHGTLEAGSLKEATAILKEKSSFVVRLVPKQNLLSLLGELNQKKKGKLNFTSLVDFTRQMGIMINAGLSLVDALSIIREQTRDQNQKLVVTRIETYIKSGSPLSTALLDLPDSFPNYYVSLVKAGESSGKLDDVFLRLADNLERSREFRGKVTGALIYPIIIVIAIVVVAFIMVTFVLPQLLELYSNFDIDLPASTRLIIALSNFMSKFWPLIILGTFLGVVFVQRLFKRPANRKVLDMYLIKIPVFGDIMQKSILVEATRTLAILIQSGVPLLEAITIVKRTTNNVLYQDAFADVYEDIEKGRSLGEALSDTNIFPPIFVQMTSVGERTGKLDDTLMRLSRYFQMESELAIKTATTLIEPAILIILGLGVGFLITSILTPIYNLTSSIGAAR